MKYLLLLLLFPLCGKSQTKPKVFPKDSVLVLTKANSMFFHSPPHVEYYVIDWDKVKTIEDMKFIISALNFTTTDNSANYPVLQRYLKRK